MRYSHHQERDRYNPEDVRVTAMPRRYSPETEGDTSLILEILYCPEKDGDTSVKRKEIQPTPGERYSHEKEVDTAFCRRDIRIPKKE